MTNRITAAALLALLLLSCGGKPVTPRETLVQRSPDGALALTFGLSEKGEPVYALSYKGQDIVLPSRMGFALMDGSDLEKDFRYLGTETGTIDETWALLKIAMFVYTSITN